MQEGYQRNSLGDYIRAIEISKGSLGELMGDVEDCYDDKLINKEEFNRCDSLCGKTDYLLNRLLIALYKKRKNGTWRKKYKEDFLYSP